MYRALQINDPHIANIPPRSRTESYLEDVLTKLREAILFAEAHAVDRIVITGDLYHRANAAQTSHYAVQRVRRILDCGIPVSLVVGNHDYARGGQLEGQPLISTLGDNVTLLLGARDDEPIAGIGWRNEFEEGPQAFVEAVRALHRPTPLIFAHAPLSHVPYPFGPEQRGWMHIDEVGRHLPGWVSLVAHGHMHNGHETRVANSVWFSNPGALARATIAADDRNREPQVALIEYRSPEHVTVNYHVLPHRPAAEVFHLERAAQEARREEATTQLAQALVAAALHEVTPETLVEHVKRLRRPDEVLPEVWVRAVAMTIESFEQEVAV